MWRFAKGSRINDSFGVFGELENRYFYVAAQPTRFADPTGEDFNASQVLHSSVGAAAALAATAISAAIINPLLRFLIDAAGVEIFAMMIGVEATIAVGAIWEVRFPNPSDVEEDLLADSIGALAGAFVWLALTGLVAPRNLLWASIMVAGTITILGFGAYQACASRRGG